MQDFRSKNSDIRVSSQYFSARVRRNKADKNRFGVVVSNKVAKKARTRNVLKRRITSYLADWENKKVDMVVYVLPGAERLSRKDVYKELDVLKESFFAKLES